MGFTVPREGEIRLGLAELLRRDPDLDERERRNVRVVTGWWDSSYERYPGTSSAWTEEEISVGYRTWDDEYQVHRLSRMTYSKMLTALERLIEDYVADER